MTSLSLFICILTISFTHEFQESKDLYEKIAKINKEISPFIKFTDTLSNMFATGPTSNDNLSALGFEGIAPQQITIYKLFLQIFRSLLKPDRGTDIDEAVQELIKSLGLNGDDTIDNLKPFKYTPFTPATDRNGKLSCLNNDTSNYFCFEDPSYPKWYMILISSSVAQTFAKVTNNEWNCTNPPKNRCDEYEIPNGLIATARCQANSRQKYCFLLQTMTLKQSFGVGRKCQSPTQTCTDPSVIGPIKCETVSDGTSNPPAGRSVISAWKSLVINSTGFLDLANILPEDLPCWCKCMVPDLP